MEYYLARKKNALIFFCRQMDENGDQHVEKDKTSLEK
jgi:hypothetical protein